jgi:hypothetical protein
MHLTILNFWRVRRSGSARQCPIYRTDHEPRHDQQSGGADLRNAPKCDGSEYMRMIFNYKTYLAFPGKKNKSVGHGGEPGPSDRPPAGA